MPELENSAWYEVGASPCRPSALGSLPKVVLPARTCCGAFPVRHCDLLVLERQVGYENPSNRGSTGNPECAGVRLRLALEQGRAAATARLSGGDPLPPEDHVVDTPDRKLEEIYRVQAPRLLRFFARRSVGCEAEDLVGESFVRMAAASAVRRGMVDNPEGYLHEIAKNLLRNRARAAFHRSLVDSGLEGGIAADPADLTARLEARDMLARMQAALAGLPAKTRTIFVAHRLDGATYAELAKLHGLSVKGVEWHMSKAIAQLHRVAGKR